jgi:hypothetical protein
LRSIRRQQPDGSSQRHSLFELWLREKMSKVPSKTFTKN